MQLICSLIGITRAEAWLGLQNLNAHGRLLKLSATSIFSLDSLMEANLQRKKNAENVHVTNATKEDMEDYLK